MKKKWFVSGFAIFFSLMLVLTACGGGGSGGGNTTSSSNTGSNSTNSGEPNNTQPNTASDGKVYELNFNISASPTHPYVKELAEPWAEYVHEQTDGRVKIHIFPSAQLGPLSKAIDDISGGVYDMGMIVTGLFQDTELYPMTTADLPFGIDGPHSAHEVMTKFKEKYMEDYFGKDITFLSIASTDGYQLITKEPVEKVEDLKNMKINTNLAGVIDVMKRVGAVPVSIPNTDIYESLEKGVIDGAIYTPVGSMSFKFYEVAPYLTKVKFTATSQLLGMSTSAFKGLPEDIQKMFIEDFGPLFAKNMAEMYTRLSDQAVLDFGEMVKDKGGRVIEFSAEELNKLHAEGKPFWDNWVQEANKRGYEGDQMMADFKNWLKEAGVEVSF